MFYFNYINLFSLLSPLPLFLYSRCWRSTPWRALSSSESPSRRCRPPPWRGEVLRWTCCTWPPPPWTGVRNRSHLAAQHSRWPVSGPADIPTTMLNFNILESSPLSFIPWHFLKFVNLLSTLYKILYWLSLTRLYRRRRASLEHWLITTDLK